MVEHAANLPHCQTPDGHYAISIHETVDHSRHFAMIQDQSPPAKGQNEGPFDSYDVTGSSPFVGKAGTDNHNSKGEAFSLVLANATYDRETDATLKATFIDQLTDSSGRAVSSSPVEISYEHLTCTRWYR